MDKTQILHRLRVILLQLHRARKLDQRFFILAIALVVVSPERNVSFGQVRLQS